MNSHNNIKKLEKAQKLLKAGKLREAKTVLDNYCKRPHAGIQGWMMLASVNGQLGLMEEVVVACDQIIAKQPNTAVAFSYKANALAAQNQHHDAIPCYSKAVELEPGNPVVLNNYAQAHYLEGQIAQAIPLYEAAIARQPAYAAAHFNLANALNHSLELAKAIHHYKEAMRYEPGLPGLQLRLANAYHETMQLEAAESCYREALRHEADYEEATRGLATMLRYQGRVDEAMSVYKSASEKFPDNIDFLAGIADTHERSRHKEESFGMIRALIDSGKPLNACAVGVLSRLCIDFDCCDEALAQGDLLLNRASTPDSEKRTTHYALGGMLDKLQRYDEAFSHYRQANELSDFQFHREINHSIVDSLIAVFKENGIGDLADSGIESELPIFIVGMPRSGTTLTEQIISSHPRVFGAGELDDINALSVHIGNRKQAEGGYPACLGSITRTELAAFATPYLQKLTDLGNGAQRITDKMPHNFFHLGLIQMLFPHARVVHCIRNPVDTCLSVYFQQFHRVHGYSTNLENIAEFYRQYQRMMKHWKSVLSTPILDIHYEELVSNQEPVSRNLIEFCGLEWDTRCLSFHKSRRNISTASYNQVNKPMYKGSVERWRNYQDHIGPLLNLIDAG